MGSLWTNSSHGGMSAFSRGMSNPCEEYRPYRCCPENCKYFKWCVEQNGTHEMRSCAEVKKMCRAWEDWYGAIRNLKDFQEACEVEEKRMELGERKCCVICGAIFTARSNRQKYCSPECHTEAEKQRKAERKWNK